MEFKKQQHQRDAKHYGLDTLEICPQCQKPRFKSESKYCFNCGREL
jgi:predicted amidophosphoribosyltransferase